MEETSFVGDDKALVQSQLDDLYQGFPYNGLKPAISAENMESTNGGNCEFLSRKFLQKLNDKLRSEMNMYIASKGPPQENAKPPQDGHVMLLWTADDALYYIEPAGRDAQVRRVPSEFVDRYQCNNAIEISDEDKKIIHKRMNKDGEMEIRCLINLDQADFSSELPQWRKRVDDAPVHNFSIRTRHGPPVIYLQVKRSHNHFQITMGTSKCLDQQSRLYKTEQAGRPLKIADSETDIELKARNSISDTLKRYFPQEFINNVCELVVPDLRDYITRKRPQQ